MKVIKIVGKKYDKKEIEANSKIIRKWYIIKQIDKEEIIGKYHQIINIKEIEDRYHKEMQKADECSKRYYEEYINENMVETYPIMKDVSSFGKIRPDDGVEFCLFI